jgi:hypothetical protein
MQKQVPGAEGLGFHYIYFNKGFHHWDPLTWIGVGETSLIFEIFLIIHLHAIQKSYKEETTACSLGLSGRCSQCKFLDHIIINSSKIL